MREGSKKILDSLAFRIIIPLSVIFLLAGFGLYIVILRSVSGFADTQIKDNLLTISRGIYSISDDSVSDLVKKGLMRDEKSIRINKALALGEIDNYMRENAFRGFIVEGKKEILSVGNLSTELSEIIEKRIKEYSVSQLEHKGNIYYVTHSHFEPWDWHILLVKDAAAYSALQSKVSGAYSTTAVILLVSVMLMLFILNRYIWNPINRIITPLKNGKKPEYTGISEFEFLSDNIAKTMDKLQDETDLLNNLYRIAVSKKSGDFFDEVAKTINKMFGLNSFIAKMNPDGETANIIAIHYDGIIKNEKPVLFKDILYKDGHSGKHVCVIEEEAYKKIPLEHLTAIKADLYLCCNIFDRYDNIIGLVTAFGKQRELTDLDIKIFHAVGQIVAAEFERLTAEREKESLREQLFHIQKLDAIGTLAGGIAHDFNNMLQGILGYAAYLKMKVPEDDPMYKPLSVIEHSAERAADLTKKLLGFARKGKYITEPLNLNAIVEDVTAIITKTFNKSIRIETVLNPLCTVEGDKNQIEQVILNLCLNSRDAMPDGGILSIETYNAEISDGTKPYEYMKNGRYAVLRVKDTGTGMDSETQRRIFEPFFTTKEVGKGTGMGLPMVYGVVKNHQGFITVDSAVGQGSTFTIYLPAAEKKVETEPEVSKAPERGKGTILVVDDEEMVRNIANDVLNELGYSVLLAAGGKEAVSIYADKKDSINLVIVDMIMPGMGGKETFQKLREINPYVKVIIASGYGQENFPEQILDNGEAGFIQKPYKITEIAEIIKEVLTAA